MMRTCKGCSASASFIIFYWLSLWIVQVATTNPFVEPAVRQIVSIHNTSTFIGGAFTAYSGTESHKQLLNGIGVWSNQKGQWQPLPTSPKSVGKVNYMVSNGTMLYMGGQFKEINHVSANSVTGYDTVTGTWVPCSGGVSGEVLWLTVHGSEVYVAGQFLSARNGEKEIPVNNVASYNAVTNTWTAIGSGLQAARVTSIAVTETAGVKIIYAVGTYVTAFGVTPFIAQYRDDTRLWMSLINATMSDEVHNEYHVIAIHPQTKEVFVGGKFDKIGGGDTLRGIGKWSGSGWQSMAGGLGYSATVNAIDFTSDGNIVIGGNIQFGTNEKVNNIAFWNNGSWVDLGGGVLVDIYNPALCLQYLTLGYVKDVTVHGDYIYVSGRFTAAAGGNVGVNNVARYNLKSGEWSVMGNDTAFSNSVLYTNTMNANGDVFIIGQEQVVFSFSEFSVNTVIFYQFNSSSEEWVAIANDPMDGFLDAGHIHALAQNGTDVYLGGHFITAGNILINNVAKWDGNTWSPLGDNVHLNGGTVFAIGVHGDDVYIGGNFNFTISSGEQLVSVAKFNVLLGTWHSMNGGINGNCSFNNSVYAIAVTDDYIYIAGSFASVGPPSGSNGGSPNIARWNIQQEWWEPVGNGIGGADGSFYVRSLFVNETVMYVGGNFILTYDQISGNISSNLAVWDLQNSAWLPFPGVMLTSGRGPAPTPINPPHNHGNSVMATVVNAIIAHDSTLIIGGVFDMLNGVLVNNIAMANISNGVPLGSGLSWMNLGAGVTGETAELVWVETLAHDCRSNILYVGGMFSSVGSLKVDNLAQWDGNDWTSVSSDVSQWNGAVHTIIVQVVVSTQELPPENPSPAYELIAIVVGASLFVIVAVLMGAFMISRIRKRRNRYVEIPSYPPAPKRMTLKDLANDAAIKRIEPNEIELGDRLSYGASGEVIKGMWKGREVAVKRMAFGQSQLTEKFMNDFLYEIKIMSSLDHKNVLKFLGASITPSGEVLLVTEYMEHGSVKDLLDKTQGHLDFKLKVRLALDAARGMEYLHTRQPPIIHRDLKSGNLLIDKRWRCKIADFGISRIKPSMTQTMTLIGTPAYMAPEVINQNKFSEKADVYSFGVLLCEVMSGEPPYADSNLFPEQVMYAVVHEGLRPTIPSDIPSALQVLVKDCLHAEPARRPDFAELKIRLKRL